MLSPINLASVTVVNLQNERYTPNTNGARKPIVNAISVGNTNTGKYLFIAFACSSPPVFLFFKKPFCAFAFHNSNYIISACPGMLVGRLFDLLLYFTAFLSAYPVKSLFYSFAAAYSSAHPSTNAVCTLSHAPVPCA